MGVVALLPDLAGDGIACGEREAALDELCATFDRHVRRGSQQGMDVIGHDDEGMKAEFAGGAVAEERGDEELGGLGALEEAAALVSYGGEGVGLRFDAHRGRACPGG